MSYLTLITILKGGTGSGNWGHAGRPGKLGGSAPKSGIGAAMSLRTGRDWEARRQAKLDQAAQPYQAWPPVVADYPIPINEATAKLVRKDLRTYHEPEALDAALATLTKLVEGSDVNMRVPSEVMDKILKDGVFKNQHATGTSRGDLDPSSRLEAERNAFGDHLSKPEELPVYAYVNTYDKGYKPSVSGYGDVRIVFNEDVKRRTTITGQDSLTPFYDSAGAPSPMLKPDIVSLDGDVDAYKTGSPPSWGYIEAQIHGPLTTKDIKHVYIPRDNKLIQQVKASGIPYTVIESNFDIFEMDGVK